MVDEDYNPLPLHFNHENILGPEPPARPPTWEGMKEMARALSQPFRYVRVDLYEYENRPIFGELTFWPLGGCCKTKDEFTFGQMLDFDLTFKRPMIHDVVDEHERGAMSALAEMARRKLPRMVRSGL